MIVADTSVWIESFRRPGSPVVREMDLLLAEGDVAITGVVLAEVLQGARSESELERLKSLLGGLPLLQDDWSTWTLAGELSYKLRHQGQGVPLTDLAVAAVCIENDCALFALDQHFQRIPGLRLHEVGGA
ncbi:MAG: PIN domain-containing protein [Chloroflexi bacterium]|nr:PIN domain-containing protein [Chloroflexota bacterium]